MNLDNEKYNPDILVNQENVELIRIKKENENFKFLIAEQESIISDLKESLESITKDAYRTIDLNFRLADSEEQLSNLNAQKDKFFSIIAHDLRNPIANFRESTQVLSDKIDNLTRDEELELIHNMAKSSKQLFELLENLLEWSRAQTGRVPFKPENISLALIIDNNISLLEGNAKNKNIGITHEVEEDIVVFVDVNMINTVIRNLLSNAIKFTPDGGTISLTGKISDTYVQLYIKDSGVGIAKENIDKLFRIDIFTSTQGTKQEKGTGLGLVLCKEFIEKHGGHLSVESELGQGSTFNLSLPTISMNSPIPEKYVSTYLKNGIKKENRIENIIDPNEITEDIKRKLPEWISYLEKKGSKLYHEAFDSMMISKIILFAEFIIDFSEKNEFKTLNDYGKKLRKTTNDLEIEKINELLENYPGMISYLKEFIN